MENKEELDSDTESEVPEAHLGSNMLVTMRSKAQENEVRGWSPGGQVITQGKQTVKGLRRNLCVPSTFKRRTEEIN